jgi:hypothetical protein
MMGAVIGLQLAQTVTSALQIPMETVQFWCDRLRGPSRRCKPFIAHRVGETHMHSNPQQWRHIPTKENPADLLSRGMRSANLIKRGMWWNGPKFLELPESEWPEDSFKKGDSIVIDQEMKKTDIAYTVRQPEDNKKSDDDMKTDNTKWRLDLRDTPVGRD